jgi:hypothetical protein
MTDLWTFSGILLHIFCGILGGACSYLLLNWVHLRVLLGIDYRVSDLEGRVNREVKIRASEASRTSRNWEKELIDKMAETPEKPKLTLENWRQNKFKQG